MISSQLLTKYIFLPNWQRYLIFLFFYLILLNKILHINFTFLECTKGFPNDLKTTEEIIQYCTGPKVQSSENGVNINIEDFLNSVEQEQNFMQDNEESIIPNDISNLESRFSLDNIPNVHLNCCNNCCVCEDFQKCCDSLHCHGHLPDYSLPDCCKCTLS